MQTIETWGNIFDVYWRGRNEIRLSNRPSATVCYESLQFPVAIDSNPIVGEYIFTTSHWIGCREDRLKKVKQYHLFRLNV